METTIQITTAPSTDDVAKLFEVFKTIPGNELKNMDAFWLFMTIPSSERDYFLESKANSIPEYADNLVIDKYDGHVNS